MRGPFAVLSSRVRYATRVNPSCSAISIISKQAFAKVPGTVGFLPVVAPASAIPNAKNEYYKDEEAYLFGLAEALRTEYRAIIDAGFDLQIDDAGLSIMYEKMVPPMTLEDYRRWASLRIEALNHALRGLPKERTRYHICWGSWNGPHMFDVPLKEIVDLILRVDVGGIQLRSGETPVMNARMAGLERRPSFHPERCYLPGIFVMLIRRTSSSIRNSWRNGCLRFVWNVSVTAKDVMASTDCRILQVRSAGLRVLPQHYVGKAQVTCGRRGGSHRVELGAEKGGRASRKVIALLHCMPGHNVSTAHGSHND